MCDQASLVKSTINIVHADWAFQLTHGNCVSLCKFPVHKHAGHAAIQQGIFTSTILWVSKVLRPTLTINSALGLTVLIKNLLGRTPSLSLVRNFLT